MLRRARLWRYAKPVDAKQMGTLAKQRGGNPFTEINPDLVRQYEDMQVGHCRDRILEKRAAREAEAALPLEERIRNAMVRNEQFSVDLVKAAGMDAEAEFIRYQRAMRKKDRLATYKIYTWMFWIAFSCFLLYYGFACFFY